MHLNPSKTGLALGAFFGLVHAAWSVLVALNLGQALIDFVLNLHMVQTIHTVGPFSLVAAAGLIVVASGVGFAAGYVFALVWNYFHRA